MSGTDASEMSSIMLFKTLTLHSLTYIVGLTSSLVVQQSIPLPSTSTDFQPVAHQIANRSVKSDRLPITQAKRRADDKAPAHLQQKKSPSGASEQIVSRQLMSRAGALQALRQDTRSPSLLLSQSITMENVPVTSGLGERTCRPCWKGFAIICAIGSNCHVSPNCDFLAPV